jgi:hypothetical protein
LTRSLFDRVIDRDIEREPSLVPARITSAPVIVAIADGCFRCGGRVVGTWKCPTGRIERACFVHADKLGGTP